MLLLQKVRSYGSKTAPDGYEYIKVTAPASTQEIYNGRIPGWLARLLAGVLARLLAGAQSCFGASALTAFTQMRRLFNLSIRQTLACSSDLTPLLKRRRRRRRRGYSSCGRYKSR